MPDMKQTYTIAMAIDSVVEDLQHGTDHSPTTIRCALNDRLDYADKDGYAVNFDYNQDRAVRIVRRRLGKG
jgi:hypothetical protein